MERAKAVLRSDVASLLCYAILVCHHQESVTTFTINPLRSNAVLTDTFLSDERHERERELPVGTRPPTERIGS